MFRKALLAAMIGAISLAHATARWNVETLAAARQQAEMELNQFLKDRSGPLTKLNDSSISSWLESAEFGKDDNGNPVKDFAHLKKRKALLDTLIGNFDKNDVDDPYREIALKALRASSLEISQSLANYYEDTVALYGRIMLNDDESILFALKSLEDFERTVVNEALAKAKDVHEKYGLPLDESQIVGDGKEKAQYLRDKYVFRLKDVDVKKEHNDKPQICLEFSYSVLPEPQQDWRSLISIKPVVADETVTPAVIGEARYAGNTICYVAEWDSRYTVRVAPTLAAQNLLEMGGEGEVRENIITGDREPMLQFVNRGKTLLSDTNAALTLESSNFDKIELSLWQIPDTNLAGDAHNAIDNPGNQYYDLSDHASLIWHGSFTPEKVEKNATAQSRIAFADMAGKETRTGVYVLSASAKTENNRDTDRIGFTVTDQGFTAYQTRDGLLAELRDLRSNQPVAGQTVTLYAQNNRILGEVKTDLQGIARFSAAQINGSGSDAPSHLISQHDGHLAYLRVTGQGIDLSDKGLSGAPAAHETLQHWSWHDRGVYRPHDTFNALWLFKTPEGKVWHDSPLWLEINRPDGALVHSQLLDADDSGAYRYSRAIANNARLGDWRIRLSLGKGGTLLVDETYRVDSVIPRQIETALTVKADDKRAQFDLKADWLYGAPAANMLTDGVWRIVRGDFAKTYPAWTGWQFGRHDEAIARSAEQRIAAANTDADGKRHIEVPFARPFDTRPQALWAMTTLTAPDGSTIGAESETLLPRKAPYVALKEGDASVQAALVNDQGEAQGGELQWTLYRVERDWYWYWYERDWRYEKNDSRHPVKSGSVSADGKTPASIELPLDYGIYVVEVRGKDRESAASLEITRGWYGTPGTNNPSTVTLASDQKTYKPGDTAILTLEAPFDGKGSVKIASRDRIIANHDITLKNGKAQLQIPWQEGWEQGVWLLANAWNEKSDDHNRRAVGLHWLGADLTALRLAPQIKLPDNPLPEQPLDVEISVPGAGADTWVNVAVVDDGLYQLAAPSFSDPLAAFYGKKILNLELYDTFGNIIRQTSARLAALRSGADSDKETASERAAMAGLPDLDLILVANWSGPLKLDADGNVRYRVPLPHYNGRLRVMTAAWNADKTGSGEQTATVKAPVVAELQSPRYLSQDDSGVFTLRLHNTTGQAKKLNIALETDKLDLSDPPPAAHTLAVNEAITLRYPYRSNQAGDAHIKAVISGDYNETLERRIPVRPPTLPLVRNQFLRLAAGETLEFTDLADARLALNSGIPYHADRYQKQLADYPLGCSEQTTGKLWGLIGAATPDRTSIHEAENRLANLAHYDGAYSLWGNGEPNLWLAAYVGEALVQLQQRELLQNPVQLTRLLQNLRANTNRSYSSDSAHDDSYAYYTLAYAGEAVRGNLLHYHRDAGDKLDRNDSLDIATALALLGEYQAANERLGGITEKENSDSYPYSSRVSLAAHNLVRLTQLQTLWQSVQNDPNHTADTIAKQYAEEREALTRALAHDSYLSTQELAWLVRLATVAPKLAADTTITVNGKTITLAELEKSDYNGAVRITNPGKQPLWLDAQDFHAPAVDEASSHGWNIELRYETADGSTTLDPAKLPNNTDIRITATFTPARLDRYSTSSDLVYTYRLPAGITLSALRDDRDDGAKTEDNNDRRREEDDGKIHYQYRENRDDRHIAAFTLRGEPRAFSYTILGRTTRAGTWHAPGATIENMYHPEEHAHQAAQTVVVVE
ncbi:MAG: alpha-2-macroglobulin [Cardiobacterium sp.]